jgi:hypothetical protein
MMASTGLGHSSGRAPACRRGVVPVSTTTPFNHGSEVLERQGCGQLTTVRKHCRPSAKCEGMHETVPPGSACGTRGGDGTAAAAATATVSLTAFLKDSNVDVRSGGFFY